MTREFSKKRAALAFAAELRRAGWSARVETYGSGRSARYVVHWERKNPQPGNWKPGKWIKASAVRVRRVAGRVVMDIKKAI